MNVAINIRNVSKAFEKNKKQSFTVIRNINITIVKGEFFILLGPSGSGKSTLLRVICGLDTPSNGAIEFGEQLSLDSIAFVFQQFALLPWLSVSENIALGLIGKGVPKSEHKKIVHNELKRLRLEKFAEARVHELSGGMRQRVGIARALAVHPDILFMDEPFSELDSFTAEDLRRDLLEIWREQQLTIVMVSHLIPEALELADRIAVLTPLPGTIEKVIENTLPRPRNKRSLEFFALEDELTSLVRP